MKKVVMTVGVDVDMFVAAGIETPLPVAPAPKAAAMKRLTIDIDAELHRRLKVACAADGQKMADFIRDLIGKHLP